MALKAFTPRAVLNSVEKFGLSFLIGAPANLEFLANTQAREPREISSLKGIVTWDQDGFITISGRMDDMIISEGENIHPAQVEVIVMEHPQVEDCIVVGIPNKVRGEVLVAYVVRNGDGLTGKELYRFLTNHPGLAKFKRPRYIKFTDQLPLTPTGKKKHFVVRQQALQDLEKGESRRY